MSETKERKWDKEMFREYHRERYRRINNIPAERFKRTREEFKEQFVKKYGEKAYEYHLDMLDKMRKYRDKAQRVVCDVCGETVCDTEGRWRLHFNTKKHKIAKETLEKHNIS